MTPTYRILPLLLLLPALPVPAAAQSGVAQSQEHLRAAAEARRAGDDAGVVASLETARELNPAGLYTQYNLARAYARSGRRGAALDLLEGLARARIDFGMAEEPDFAGLLDDPRYDRLVAALAAATAPVAVSDLLYVAPRLDLLAEGIAWDAAGERLFFGSMRTGEVFVFDRRGRLGKFADVAADGPVAAIGMTVDPGRNLLWVVGATFFLAEGFDENTQSVSGVYGFDLDSGAPRARYLRDDAGHGYNDVTLAGDGTLYLSGAELGRLVPGDGARIETIATSEPVFGSNGIVVSEDGGRLITSAYPSGIAVVELAGGATRFLGAPDGVSLYGIDGLYLHDGDLVAVQNGTRPWRLMRFALDDDLTRVLSARALEFGTPDVPTTGAIVGDVIHYVAQEPAVDDPPPHFDESMHRYLGRTVIRTAPLD